MNSLPRIAYQELSTQQSKTMKEVQLEMLNAWVDPVASDIFSHTFIW